MSSTIAALLFAALAAFVGVFQLALACGAPWGELTLGGRFPGALPGRMRAAAMASAILIAGFAAIVIARAQLAFANLEFISPKLIWAVVAYCVIGCALNYFTPSKRERALWFPVVAAMFNCSLLVALR